MTYASGLDLLASKAKLSTESIVETELKILIYIDACKRGQGFNYAVNYLTKHLAMAAVLANLHEDQGYHNAVSSAYSFFAKAAERADLKGPSGYMSLTTKEYTYLKDTFREYVKRLHRLQVGQFVGASIHASKILGWTE